MLGTYVLRAGYYDAYYRKAQQVRALIKRDFDEAFARGRRDPDADRADRRLPDRREERRRSTCTCRRLHAVVQPRRPARALGARAA
jgi:hypothetical protein